APKRFSAAALAKLQAWRWPGNVRELRNVVQRAYVMAEGDLISDEWLPSDGLAARAAASTANPTPVAGPDLVAVQELRDAAAAEAEAGDMPTIVVPIGTPLAEAERRLILASLAHFRHHKERTAAALGVSLKTLYNRLKDYAADEET